MSAPAQTVPVVLAALGGEYMESALIVRWLVAIGDRVSAGAPLVVVETAKASAEVEATVDGVVAAIRVEAGAEVEVGAVLAELAVEAAMPVPSTAGSASSDRPRESTGAPAAAGARPLEPRPAEHPAAERRRVSPAARRRARELGIDAGGLAGSGPLGRVLLRDVESAAREAMAARRRSRVAPPPADYRRAMATHMARAAAAPQFSVSMDVDWSALERAREAVRALDVAASPNDMVVHAVSRVLARSPEMNAWCRDGVVERVAAVNVGVAIATPGGLAVPVVRGADRLGLAAIAAETARLGRAARTGDLAPDDVLGATFTVSNLAPYGVSEFRAVVSPPQAAILAVPAATDVLALDGGRVVVRPVTRLTVTADHRAVDGAQVARFLRRLRRALERYGVDSGAPENSED
ncbi:MAG: 2-oxo acid dehydrogenase subunit E2 [Ectothiorhodospiraceae bacterium]|nr:2-oxo acid dehydrogenase subunit E2 [Ectothiorhodospiraceae bacterium]